MDSEVQKRQGLFSKIPRKLKWLIAALVFNNIAIGYLIVYLTGFFPELGVSAGVVGLLLGLEGAMVLLRYPLEYSRTEEAGRNCFSSGRFSSQFLS
jgi:hypothetical protein